MSDRQYVCPTQTFSTICAAFGLLILLGGCGDANENRLAVHPVSGKVLNGGKPAAGVQVVLHPLGNAAAKSAALYPNGVTDENGQFRLTSYAAEDGAPNGEWAVTLSWPDDSLPAKMKEELLSNGDSLPDRLKGRYATPDKSKWRITISDDTTELEPIVLK